MEYTPKTKFSEFYQFYLQEHSHPICRLLHAVGSVLVIFVLLYAIITKMYVLLIAAPIIGYGFAWTGHFAFEKNRPLTFKQPFFSLMADYLMLYHLITRKI